MKKIVLAAAAVVAGLAGGSPAATVPGAVYSDQQATGANRPPAKVAEDLAKAGVTDVKADYYAAGSITVLLEAGLLKPDAYGRFNPDAPLSTPEGVAIFAKVLGIASKTDDPATALAKAKAAGLVPMSVSGSEPFTRLDTARLIAMALGVAPAPVYGPANYPFSDFAATPPGDLGILKALYEAGIFKGYPDRTFRPANILTRAEIAILIDRILGAH